MILKSSTNRVILWGCAVTEEYVTAELSFFEAGLSTKLVDLGEVTIELPDAVLNQNLPCKLPPHQTYKRISTIN
jgi:hypothetical protein